ncbi:hypothetical protein [Spiroplasma phoeniceum]|uniref:Restriction endonuclease type IV Mrr domain-containing protein n=1 Tax=Spiroplasma phoeniceum P40 TaxID=1276259 RepID=A0A345DLX9_9MOLU|nr:hypothetical protein [Spiroplasma phoeniceum]AXF95217.1 hypothetical protein SDAV_00222 [Spiroplasma phoeniceum P40]
METYPNLYRYSENNEIKIHNENTIRDFILLILSLNFEASITAESFNRGGKTDIMLKYNNENVFIAECKFWNGEKKFLEAIDQLQGYLTWRDTKTALIIFVKENDISSIINKIRTKIIQKHKSFIKECNFLNDSCIIYDFSFKQDTEKKFKLAVLFYHLV